MCVYVYVYAFCACVVVPSCMVISLLSWSPILSGKHYSVSVLGLEGKLNRACTVTQAPTRARYTTMYTGCFDCCCFSIRHWLSCVLLCINAELIDPCCSHTVGVTIASPNPNGVTVFHLCFSTNLENLVQPQHHLLWKGFLHVPLPTWKLCFSLTLLPEPASTISFQSRILKLE